MVVVGAVVVAAARVAAATYSTGVWVGVMVLDTKRVKMAVGVALSVAVVVLVEIIVFVNDVVTCGCVDCCELFLGKFLLFCKLF